MMRLAPFVLMTIVLGALVGWFGPDASEQVRAIATPAPGSPSAAGPDRLAMVQEEASVGGEVVLPRGEDGHFYAEVTIDGATSHMLVDTGATVIALTGEDADAMGIYWDETAVQPVARGASGMVYGVPITLETVELGPIEARGVEAIVVPQGLGISLLGQSFLSRIGKVEMDQQRMVLGS